MLLTIFCRGVLAAEAKWLMLGAAISILPSPVGWIVLIAKKLIHLAIVFAIWWLLREQIAALGVSEYTVLALAMVAIFYKEIYTKLQNLFLNFLVFVTGGRFLRWMCTGYLSGTGFRQLQLTRQPMERLVGAMVAIIPRKYRSQYDEIIDLYLDSNQPANESRLNELLDEYLQGGISSQPADG